MRITKEKFMQFENVRLSGQTNMWDTQAIVMLADDLDEDEVREIRKRYTELADKYLVNR
jgi:hypothetical protein